MILAVNLSQITEQFNEAVEAAEQRWAALKHERTPQYNRRLLARYIRSLRKCDRLRHELQGMLESGRL